MELFAYTLWGTPALQITLILIKTQLWYILAKKKISVKI